MHTVREYLHSMNKVTVFLTDTAAVGLVVGAWFQYIPAIAAGFAAFWYGIQIWESKTVQRLISIKDRYHERKSSDPGTN
jgi:hypothetical protein